MPPPIGPYKVAKKYDGLVFLSGQIGRNEAGEISPNITIQTEQVMQNLNNVLVASGSSFDNVVKCNIFLTVL